MNNYNQSNLTLKLLCYFILIVTSIVSMSLTAMFAYSLGNGTTLSFLFLAFGIAIDLFKTASPTIIKKTFEHSIPCSVFAFFLAATLVVMSGFASIASLERGVDSALQNSRAAIVAKAKAENISSQIDGMKIVLQSQLNADQVTNASKTSASILAKTDELNALLDQSTAAGDDSMLGQFSGIMMITFAIIIELSSLCVSWVISTLNSIDSKQNTQTVSSGTGQNNAKHVGTNTVPSPAQTRGFHETQGVLVSEQNTPRPVLVSPEPQIVFAAKTREQITHELKVGLHSSVCKPTIRSVYAAFNSVMKKAEVTEYLAALADQNVLVRVGGGQYRLA